MSPLLAACHRCGNRPPDSLGLNSNDLDEFNGTLCVCQAPSMP